MHILPLIAEGVIATFLMTAFDYLLAIIWGKRIKVVKILGTMLTAQTTYNKSLSDRPSAIVVGLLAHYSVGILFSVVYHFLWINELMVPTIINSIWLGLASGVVAIVVWRTFIAIHPDPPIILLSNFLLVIFFAHIIFAATMVGLHRLWSL